MLAADVANFVIQVVRTYVKEIAKRDSIPFDEALKRFESKVPAHEIADLCRAMYGRKWLMRLLTSGGMSDADAHARIEEGVKMVRDAKK